MALPRKGLRKITVENRRYAWSATGNDGHISLSICPLDNNGQILLSQFRYHSRKIGEFTLADGTGGTTWKQSFIITPYIVRQVILHALRQGWSPIQNAPPLNIGSLDEVIDLRLLPMNSQSAANTADLA